MATDLCLANRNPLLSTLLAGRELGPETYKALFYRDVKISTGRVRGAQPPIQARSVMFTDLADVAFKAGLYAAVAEGFKLVAVAGYEFVLEVPGEVAADDTLQRVEGAARKGMGRVLTKMPVSLRVDFADRW